MDDFQAKQVVGRRQPAQIFLLTWKAIVYIDLWTEAGWVAGMTGIKRLKIGIVREPDSSFKNKNSASKSLIFYN